MALQLPGRRFTTAEYHRLAEVGVLAEDDRVELIDGEILEMSPISPKNAAYVTRLHYLFLQEIGDGAIVSVRHPVQLGEYSEPEPDLALLRPQPDSYASGHPTPEHILLSVEVADASFEYDKQVKVPLYAQSGIPEMWLVDLERELLIVYVDPTPTGYDTIQFLWRGDTVSPSAFPHLKIAVTAIFG
jgi:Uma2 family endonuclease